MRDSFITHSLSSAEVHKTISWRRAKLVGCHHMEPFVLTVTSPLKEISSYFVIVDNTFYRLNSIISSIDCCFKIIITLNAKYSSEREKLFGILFKKGCSNYLPRWIKTLYQSMLFYQMLEWLFNTKYFYFVHLKKNLLQININIIFNFIYLSFFKTICLLFTYFLCKNFYLY